MAERLLTKEQVNDVIEFSQALWTAENMGYYSPFISNQLLKSLNNNPNIPTVESIKKALTNYKNSGEELQGYTEFMSNFDMIFKRTMYSYINALSFDLQIVCTNAFTKEDYDSDAYKEDKQRIYGFLDKFDYKKEFRNVVSELMQKEVYYTWFRKTKWGNKGMKCTLQILPQDRCMLTGYWENGLLFDFDMNYFLMPGVDIDGYDPIFKKYYNSVFGDKSSSNMANYKPTNPLNSRNGTYALWTQTSPEDGAWAFKFDTNNFNTAPFLAPFLKDTIRNSEIEQLQYDKDFASAYAILAGEIRLFDNAKSGTTANQFAIDPKTLGAFMGKAKAGLEKVKLAALPLENTKFHQYEDKNKDMYTNQLINSAGAGSGISRVIYSSDRMSNAEIEAGLTEMYNTMKPLYAQFQNFLNFFANKLTKKYKFKFIFDGSNYRFERESRLERLMKLADKGIVLGPSAWASVMGYAPQDFERLLDETNYGDFSTKWRLMLNTNTSKDGGSGGRPQKDDMDLSESGQDSRDV